MGDLSSHFDRHEFACHCGCGHDSIDAETLRILEALRAHFGAPVNIHSAYRCPGHNAAVGGASDSQHLFGRAADVDVEGQTPDAVADWLDDGPLKDRGGLGRYNTFVHLDSRTHGPARWSG